MQLAAVEAARGSSLCLLAVSVLTSMDEQDMIDVGYEYDPHTLVLCGRSEQALHAGMAACCSASRSGSGPPDRPDPDMAVVTPRHPGRPAATMATRSA